MKKLLFFITLFIIPILVFAEEKTKLSDDTIYYELKISEKYEEKITIFFTMDFYEKANNDRGDVPSLEYIMVYEKLYPILSNMGYEYTKEVKETVDGVLATLTYTFSKDEFAKSTFFNNCFEKSTIKESDGTIEYDISGQVYCLHGRKLNVVISSDYEIEGNGTKKDNQLVWNFNNNKMDFQLKVTKKEEIKKEEKKEDKKTNSFVLVIFVVLLVVLFILSKVVKIKK